MSVTVREIIAAIEEAAPLALREQWDNCGLIIGSSDAECSGVMLCLDVTPEVIAEAVAAKCNLVVSHHPLIFKGVKEINDFTLQGRAIIDALKADIAVYSAHTSLDNAPAPWGVSHHLAARLGTEVISTMTETGTGVLARLPRPVGAKELAMTCINVFDAAGLRHSAYPDLMIETVVIGSGACGFLLPEALSAGAQAIITSDVRYHDFLDFGRRIFIVDLTHFDTEKCTKEIFRRIISQKIPNFAPVFCADETNPIEYL